MSLLAYLGEEQKQRYVDLELKASKGQTETWKN